MNKKKFVALYATQMMASMKAHSEEFNRLHGRHDLQMDHSSEIEESFFMAEQAWKQLQDHPDARKYFSFRDLTFPFLKRILK